MEANEDKKVKDAVQVILAAGERTQREAQRSVVETCAGLVEGLPEGVSRAEIAAALRSFGEREYVLQNEGVGQKEEVNDDGKQ